MAENDDLDLTVPSPFAPGRNTPPVIEGVTEPPGGGASGLPASHAPAAKKPARRRHGRLRLLLAINAFVAALYLLSQLDPTTVKKLGPVGEYVFNVLHPSGDPDLISEAGQRLTADVLRMGGAVDFMGRTYRFLGRFGPIELYLIRIDRPDFDDDDLGRLVNEHGSQIWGLDLRNTRVTDEGLRHLEGLSQIQQLTLGNDDRRFMRAGTSPVSPITDAGLVHLKGLTQLTNLNLCGLPITDAGLGALKDLPQLGGLYLGRTKIEGQGLAGLKSLPTLALLYLDDSSLTDTGLGSLAGASNLQMLSVSRVPLTPKGLQAVKGLPKLNTVDLTGCGLLDEEVLDLKKSRPGLKILRY